MVLDEPKAKDKVYEFEPLKMIIDDDLQEQVGSVSVDYSDSVWRSGFSVTAGNDIRGLGSGGCC